MTINEQIVTGRKFRKLIDEASRLWLRISFWTKASDVEFDDGEDAETKFSNIVKSIDKIKQAFQDGVNKIYNKLSGLGFTPKTNSPDYINEAIQNMYDDRYELGFTNGFSGKIPGNAKITYTYHQHTGNSSSGGGCYTVLRTGTHHVGCSGEITCINGPYGPDTSGNMYWTGDCPVCGYHVTSHTLGEHMNCPNGSDESYSYYDLGCGMSENTILKAVIDFKH